VDLVEADKAKQEFEELLAAVWAEQLAQLRTPPNSGHSVAESSNSVKTQETGK